MSISSKLMSNNELISHIDTAVHSVPFLRGSNISTVSDLRAELTNLMEISTVVTISKFCELFFFLKLIGWKGRNGVD